MINRLKDGTGSCEQNQFQSNVNHWKYLWGALVALLAAIVPTVNACVVTNLPPTVCVELLPACQAKIVVKGYSTYVGAPGSQFCSCAFAMVPSIISVDSVEIRQCSGQSNEVNTCSTAGALLPGFDDGLGGSTFVTDNLANSFFAAASGSALPWQGFFSAVYGAGIPSGACVDIIFYVTLQSPCSITQLATELSTSGPILGASSAQSDGTPNGGHLSLTTPASISIVNQLAITKSGNQISISWAASSSSGTLKEATSLAGPWTPVSGSGNPRFQTISPSGQRFYRLEF